MTSVYTIFIKWLLTTELIMSNPLPGTKIHEMYVIPKDDGNRNSYILVFNSHDTLNKMRIVFNWNRTKEGKIHDLFCVEIIVPGKPRDTYELVKMIDDSGWIVKQSINPVKARS